MIFNERSLVCMTVKLRFICREVVGNARSGDYTVADGSSVEKLMENAAAENGTFIDNYLDHVIYMVNSRPASRQTILNDGDSVTVLRKVHGG